MDSPLRPMTLGELLDRTFSLYRRRFALFVGIMAIPAVVVAIGATGMQFAQEPLAQIQGEDPTEMSAEMAGYAVMFAAGAIVFSLVYWVVYSVALGATSSALTRVFLGRAITVREAYRSVRDRFVALILLPILIALVVFGTQLIALMAVGIVGGIGTAISAYVGVPVIIAGALADLVFLGWLGLGYSIAIPALVVENTGMIDAMRRSWILMSGHRMRALLIWIMMIVVGYAANLILQGPLVVATIVASMQGGMPPLWMRAAGAVGGSIAGALTGPLLMLSLALLYFDIRMRKEALDLQLMAQGSVAGAAESLLPPPPAPGSLAP